ncbi:acyl carrier protein familyprotein [Actinobacteria bacterium OK074]|nr:acyl carrier protein familyprotein [Actinobacteria bacterium OK074]
MSSVEEQEEKVKEEKVEERIVGLWREILGRPDAVVAAGDDFFAVGGTSMQAMGLVQRVQEEFGVPFGLGDLLEDSTLGSVTKAVEGALAERGRN